jgi:hypothetical protein
MATTQSERGQSPRPEAGHAAQGAPHDTARMAREQAGAVWNDARDIARSKLSEQQHEAASGLGDFAGALRNAAREVEGRQQPTVARLAQCAADGLEQLSGTLRSKDLNSMVREAETFARSQPVAFFGAAVAAGFLAVRFLKSSEDQPQAPTNTLIEE